MKASAFGNKYLVLAITFEIAIEILKDFLPLWPSDLRLPNSI